MNKNVKQILDAIVEIAGCEAGDLPPDITINLVDGGPTIITARNDVHVNVWLEDDNEVFQHIHVADV